MIDPRREAVLIRPSRTATFQDETATVARYVLRDDGGLDVVHVGGPKVYPYGRERVAVLRRVRSEPVPDGARVEVDGQLWRSVPTEVLTFADGVESWTRVFYRTTDGGEAFSTRPSSAVRLVVGAAAHARSAKVLGYLRSVVARLPREDYLHHVYRSLDFVHPDSVLARYLAAAPIVARADAPAAIFPFRRNLSQWAAVDNALAYPLSVIEGPPGTGKTETILNLTCSIVAAGAGTVGVVSSNNAAVDNVHAKLCEAGLGDMVALLGRSEKRSNFFDGLADRRRRSIELRGVPVAAPQPARLAALDAELRSLYDDERRRAQTRGLLAAFELERAHFTVHLDRHEPADLAKLPLLDKSPRRILEFLAETAVDPVRAPGLLRRLRRYLRYGRLHGLDPQDTDVLLSLQDAFYRRRIEELTAEAAGLDRRLAGADFDRLAAEHRDQSVATLHDALHRRYAGREPVNYREADYRRRNTFSQFVTDHPVILSTCHSLRRSLAADHLLDWLVIDEASQVDLLAAAPALASCRAAVIVGDRHQLAHIDTGAAQGLTAPHPAYDYAGQSILTSVQDLYGDDLPRVTLREHYRCDPAIIGFCNRAFYGDTLVPYTTSRGTTAMEVRPTPPGFHKRHHAGGGWSNQRELDVIAREVVPDLLETLQHNEIGITTPFRRQVDKASDVLDRHETDTVHRFQGRQKRAVILSTVIDDTRWGRTVLRFVDDPRLVNVAVSRAIERFVLVTDGHFHPTSRHLRDLVDWMNYQNLDAPPKESAVLSVFDLLYQEYSHALEPFARRVRGASGFRSENIVETLLAEILSEPEHAHLASSRQIALRNLLPDLEGLDERETAFVRHHRTSVDFVVYNRIAYVPLLAIEVDGFAFHENRPDQLERDRRKDAILARHGLRVLRLPTTGSDEERRIRAALDAAQQARESTAIDLTGRVVDVRDDARPASGSQQ